jgi:lysophospholipase L1-like esterase
MKHLHLASLALAALTVTSFAQTVRTLRWAAIGNGVVTTGANGYPTRLGIRLPADSVIAYGVPGATVLKSGDTTYWNSGALAQVFAYQPDIVSIHLGGNDAEAANWADSANFERDYKALIDTLSSMPSKPRILVVYPVPSFQTVLHAPSQSVIANGVIPRLRKIAKDKGADTADLHAPFLGKSAFFTDGGTATTAGNDSLAKVLLGAFIGQSIRIMCVGNSITQANGTTGGVTVKDAYPYRLNMRLGPRYWVWNGGRSGWWMQRAQLPGASASFKSYVTDKALMDTLFLWKPHYITIKLGTNDARKYFWNTARYVNDYRYMIDTLYNNMTPKPKIFMFKAFPAWKVNGNWAFPNSGWTADTSGINGDIIRDSLGPAIDAIAASRPTQVVGVVDLYTPFAAPTQNTNLSTDGVHPNKLGQDSLARVVYKSILPIVTSIRATNPGKALGPVAPARAVRVLRTGTGKPARGAGLKSLDGKSAGKGGLAPGVYIQPAARAAKKDAVQK